MNICDQCGQSMVTEDYYRENRGQFQTEPKFNNHEHIIPNALLGKLKAYNILCKKCGNDYSGETDKNFVSPFQIITETVKDVLIKKDHGKNSSNTLKGILHDEYDLLKKRDVLIRDNKITPKEPFYEHDDKNSVVSIYANKERAKQYKKVAAKELKDKGIGFDSLEYKVIDNIQETGVLELFFS